MLTEWFKHDLWQAAGRARKYSLNCFPIINYFAIQDTFFDKFYGDDLAGFFEAAGAVVPDEFLDSPPIRWGTSYYRCYERTVAQALICHCASSILTLAVTGPPRPSDWLLCRRNLPVWYHSLGRGFRELKQEGGHHRQN